MGDGRLPLRRRRNPTRRICGNHSSLNVRFYQVIYGKLVQREGGPIIPGAGHQRTAWSPELPQEVVALCTPEAFNLKPKSEWRDSRWKDSPYAFSLTFHTCCGTEWAIVSRATGLPEGSTNRLYTHAHFLIIPATEWHPRALANVLTAFSTQPTVADTSEDLPALELDANAPALRLPDQWIRGIRPFLIGILSGQTQAIDPLSEPLEASHLIRVCLAALPPTLAARCPVGAALGSLTEQYAIGHAYSAELPPPENNQAALFGTRYVEWLTSLPLENIDDTDQLAAVIAQNWDFLHQTIRPSLDWRELAKCVRDNISETCWVSELQRALAKGKTPPPMPKIAARCGEVLALLLKNPDSPATLAAIGHTYAWEAEWAAVLYNSALTPAARPWAMLWGYISPSHDDIPKLIPLLRNLSIPIERIPSASAKLSEFYDALPNPRLWITHLVGATGFLKEWAEIPLVTRNLIRTLLFQAGDNRIQIGRDIQLLRNALSAAIVFDPETPGTIQGANIIADALSMARSGTIQSLFRFYDMFPDATPSAINRLLLQLAFEHYPQLQRELPKIDENEVYERLAIECETADSVDEDFAFLLLANAPQLLDQSRPTLRKRFATILGGASEVILEMPYGEHIAPNYTFIHRCVSHAKTERLAWWLGCLMRLVDFEIPNFEAKPGSDIETNEWEARWAQLCRIVRKLLERCTLHKHIIEENPTAQWLAYYLQIVQSRPRNPDVLPEIRRRLVFLLAHTDKQGTGMLNADKLVKTAETEIEVLLCLYASDANPHNVNSRPPPLRLDQFATVLNDLAEAHSRDATCRQYRDWRRIFKQQPPWRSLPCWLLIFCRIHPPDASFRSNVNDDEKDVIERLSPRNIAFLLIHKFQIFRVHADDLCIETAGGQPLPPDNDRSISGVIKLGLANKPQAPEIMRLTFSDLENLARAAVERNSTKLLQQIRRLADRESNRLQQRRSTSIAMENYADLAQYCEQKSSFYGGGNGYYR